MGKINLEKRSGKQAVYGTPAERDLARRNCVGTKKRRASWLNCVRKRLCDMCGVILLLLVFVLGIREIHIRKVREAERIEEEIRIANAKQAHADSIATAERNRRHEEMRHRANLIEAQRQKKLREMWKDYSWDDIINMVHKNCPAYGGMSVYRADNENWLLRYSIATGRYDHLDSEIYDHYLQRFNPRTRRFQKAQKIDEDYSWKQKDNTKYAWNTHKPLYNFYKIGYYYYFKSIDGEITWSKKDLLNGGDIPVNKKNYKPYKPTREDIIYDAVYDRVSEEYDDEDDIDAIIDDILDDMGY